MYSVGTRDQTEQQTIKSDIFQQSKNDKGNSGCLWLFLKIL